MFKLLGAHGTDGNYINSLNLFVFLLYMGIREPHTNVLQLIIVLPTQHLEQYHVIYVCTARLDNQACWEKRHEHALMFSKRVEFP